MKLKHSEREIQKAVIQYLKIRGYICWRQNSVGIFDQKRGTYRLNAGTMPGIADIVVLLPDRTIMLEVKAGKNDQQVSQIAFERLWVSQKAGREYYVVRSLADVIDLGL